MRISGHGLQDEGAAYSAVNCDEGVCAKAQTVGRMSPGTGGAGHGLCACGWLSGHLESGAARQAAHEEHKAAVAPSEEEPPAEAPKDEAPKDEQPAKKPARSRRSTAKA